MIDNPRTPHQALQARERLGRAFTAAGGDPAWWAGSRDLVGVLAHDILTAETVVVPPSDPDPDVTISHTIEDGTVADFPKNKELFGVLRRYGFLWVRSLSVVRRQAASVPRSPPRRSVRSRSRCTTPGSRSRSTSRAPRPPVSPRPSRSLGNGGPNTSAIEG